MDDQRYNSPKGRKPLRTSPRKSPVNSLYQPECYHPSNESYDYSEESDGEISHEYSSKNISLNSTRSANRTNDSTDYTYLRRQLHDYSSELNKHSPASFRDELNKHTAVKKIEISRTAANDQESSFNIYFVVAIVAALVGASVFFLYPAKSLPTKVECPQFRELSEHYKNQDISLWKSLKKNIENVVNQTPAQPSVFLLVHHDAEMSERMMANILNATAYCMNSRNPIKSRDPIKLDGSSFATEVMLQDYGEIIAAYRQRLEREGIMYVSDVQKVPSKAAQAFHTICDTVTPLVERSVIFFTMYMDQYIGNMSPQEVHHLVETQLENNWMDINHDTLNALIGRITDQVFLLHSENDVL
ncbi:uncharacterized protein LOC129579352 [Sitodiplosis mosellana]|uniref:uncharacterized protein LOC129579352 n=1 Tax=Sitodiplosis mosellana TaxID=263140 RepID=UPI0024443F28|nr:uncharacterized protein LOC129579352 [Sitodiplosis mosellana]